MKDVVGTSGEGQVKDLIKAAWALQRSSAQDSASLLCQEELLNCCRGTSGVTRPMFWEYGVQPVLLYSSCTRVAQTPCSAPVTALKVSFNY